ncbi:hypothetical protein LTR91_024736 [Friedmanniomyces endolithicus]|uniref:HMA domain-containing protein n=1 Tax=Friedmanniomyces endolithicus TaxID=329885 RepID=A0AAN6H198_9PEZI|nr:hypothetical protein LTR57_024815 [Friedmanniomyces endolithicus]KAK0951877.1 hypothetical protein LTR91_024736 [Friedmanniomyces endolithicus]
MRSSAFHEGALRLSVNRPCETTSDELDQCQTTRGKNYAEKTTKPCEKRLVCGESPENTVAETCTSPCGNPATRSNNTCCREPDERSAPETKTCCSEITNAVLEESTSKGCCGNSNGFAARPKTEIDVDLDIEKGTSFREHVSLSVGGLTCSGCETKLYKALHDIRGVDNLHTSLVLSQAEFDLDEQAESVEDLVKAVEKATGFTCQRLNIPSAFTLMSVLGPREIRMTFDPKIIGARALLDDTFRGELRLSTRRKTSDLESGRKHVRHTAWITLLSAVLTIPVLALAWAPLAPRPVVYGAVSLALATALQVLVAGQFYVSALRALIFTRIMEMDLLILLSTTTAYVCSVVSFAFQVKGHPLAIGEFFETSTLLVTLIMLGRLVSAFARQKAVETVSVQSLQRQTAVLCDQNGGNAWEIDARLLQYGDFFKVDPDSRITTHGIVVIGATDVDESMVTGEAMPIDKRLGSLVVAGSINGSGAIVVRLTNLPGNNTISTIAAMVNEAKFQKAKTQELVDLVASWFVPIVLALATITFLVWIAVGIVARDQSTGTAVVNAITYGVSVLIVSCPCALGLCVPMVIVIGGGAAAKHDIIVKAATAYEDGCKVSHVALDKTGTLTEGKLTVANEVMLAPSGQLAMSVTLGLVNVSKQPVSVAVTSHLKAKGVEAAALKDVRSIAGKGVEGTYNGDVVRCGNSRWLSLEHLPEVQALLGKGLTVFCVTINHDLVCIFGLSDRLRPETSLVLAELKRRKIAISIISGDDAGATEILAAQLEIPLSNVRSRCTPADKQSYLENLPRGKHDGTIFCGDGTNDAVALAQAKIGLHMSTGSEIARTAADVVLLRPSLDGILVLLDLSHAAMHRVYLNFAWSFVYNLFSNTTSGGCFRTRADTAAVCWVRRDCECTACHSGGAAAEVLYEAVC